MLPDDPEYRDADLEVEPESEPPASDPDVREALDRMEDEHSMPDAEDAADRDEDADEQTEGEAPTG